MILQALTRYYETLREQDLIAPRYYSKTGVSFGLQLDAKGNLIGLIPLKISVERGKRNVAIPQEMLVPEQKLKSGTKPPANFLCDNAAFMLGLDTKDKPEQALMYFQTAKDLHIELLEGVQSEAAEVLRLYFENWSPQEAASNEHIIPYLSDFSRGGQLIFVLPDGSYAHNDPDILAAWEQHNLRNPSPILMQCLVTGKMNVPISLTHPKIWNLDPSQSFGGSLVSFNDPAYESYGHELRNGTGQGLNAPVSEYAAFAYTTALNHLISSNECHLKLGDDMLVFWAENAEFEYQQVFCGMMNPRLITEKLLYETLAKIVLGSAIDIDGIQMITPFYILCLSPSTSRISIRYFFRDTFGHLAENIVSHYRDLSVVMDKNEPMFLTLDDLVYEVSTKEQSSFTKKLTSEILRSIIYNLPYPRNLYTVVLSRARKNPNENARTRISIIKACLSRYARSNQCEEEPTVALNEQSTNKAYNLGRLFALLEKTQLNAIDNIRTTITDRFFDAACTNPQLAFASLLKLNRHHLAKDDQYGVYYEKRICAVMDKLNDSGDPFPTRHTLEQQGLFILGYYHQKQDIYTSKTTQNAE